MPQVHILSNDSDKKIHALLLCLKLQRAVVDGLL